MGAAIIPIIHYSVQLWRGQHPTVITRHGGGLAPAMLNTLFVSLTAFTLMAAAILLVRTRIAMNEAKLEELRTEATSAGLTGEES